MSKQAARRRLMDDNRLLTRAVAAPSPLGGLHVRVTLPCRPEDIS